MAQQPTQNTPTLPQNAGKTIGASGTWITGGIITLEEYNYRLTGRHGRMQYDIMRRSDSTIRAIMQVCKLPLLGAKWDLLAAKIDPDDPEVEAKQKIADYKARFIKRELMGRNVNFTDLIKSLLTALEFGFDVEEKTLELTEFEGATLVGIQSLQKRKQTTVLTWALEDGLTPGITQLLPGKTVYIPMAKLIVFTHEKEGDNYEGIPMLRFVYKDWDIKDKLTIVNAIALEKLAVGIPHVHAVPNMTASEQDRIKARESLSNFRANQQGYVESPASLDISMLDLKANSTKDVIPTLTYHDSRISKSILAGFLEIGGRSGSGSQALAKDLTSLFMKSEEAIANVIISTLSDQLIKQICDANWTDMSEGYPAVAVSHIADDDVAGLTTAAAAVIQAGGITPDAGLDNYLRVLLGAPELPDDIKDNYADHIAKPAPVAVTPPADATPEKGKDALPDEEDAKVAKQKKAVRAARRARANLIDTLTG